MLSVEKYLLGLEEAKYALNVYQRAVTKGKCCAYMCTAVSDRRAAGGT